MKETLRVWAVVTFMILATVMQMNVMADANAGKNLKEDLEIAVHDAALFIDKGKLANGKIVFDEERAFQAFQDSLELNAQLQSLTPENSSFYQDRFKIVAFQMFDDSNTQFPYTYHHPLYDMDIVLSGPTIIAIVETYAPRYFHGNQTLIRRAAFYTYQR